MYRAGYVRLFPDHRDSPPLFQAVGNEQEEVERKFNVVE